MIDLRNIKNENLRSVLDSVAKNGKISRAGISEKTGLSLVTVGKISDALLERELIYQVKEAKKGAGRRAGALCLNEKKFVLILDLTSYDFFGATYDLGFKEKERFSFTYNKSVVFEKNLKEFISSVFLYISENDPLDCIGIGVLISGKYDRNTDTVMCREMPELSEIKLKKAVGEYFEGIFVTVGSYIDSAAIWTVKRAKDYSSYSAQNAVFLHFGKEVTGALIADGRLFSGMNGNTCDPASMMDERGEPLKKRFDKCVDITEICCVLSYLTGNIVKLFYPDSFIITGLNDKEAAEIPTALKEKLISKYNIPEKDIPEFLFCAYDPSDARRGLCMVLRERFTDGMVFGERADEATVRKKRDF